MARHNHAHLHRRQGFDQNIGQGIEQGWNDFTSAVDSAWDNVVGGDKDTKKAKTVSVTQYQTNVPSGYSGPLSTVPPATTSSAGDAVSAASQTAAVSSAPESHLLIATSSEPTTVIGSNTLPASLGVQSSQSLDGSLAMATSSPTIPIIHTPQVSAAPTSSSASDLSDALSSSPTASPAASSSSDGDVSTAAKAGIAIGILAAILVVGMALFFLYSKRRRQMEQDQANDSEKPESTFADAPPLGRNPSTRTVVTATAPRLSLRPVTQFLPNLNPHPDRRASRGVDIALQPSPTGLSPNGTALNKPSQGGSLWERPSTSSSSNPNNPFSNDAAPANPFGYNAERIAEEPEPIPPPSPIESEAGAATTRSISPISDDGHADPDMGVAGAVVGAGVAGAAAGAAAIGVTRKQSIRKDVPKPLDLTRMSPQLGPVPPSPAGTEFSMHSVAPGQSPGPSGSAAAIAAAGGPPQSTVHRVQLDFKPTLDDELGLQAGQLVRLLHEYDDGWALCIRLDRSQQGVVPRTCLSARPVKPRGPPQGGPRGPPVNPNRGPGPNYPGQRPMGPMGSGPMGPQGRPAGPPYPRPESPARAMNGGGHPMNPYGGPRPASPSGRPMSPYGARPASPGGRAMSPGPRSQSPGPRQQQGRPQSPSGMNGRRMTPPGPSPMNQEYQPDNRSSAGSIGRKPVPGQAY